MPLLKPDPTFYPSPTMAMQSPPEKLAYMALINPLKDGRPDAIGVVDVDPDSKSYGRPRWSDGHVPEGERTASLRLERLQFLLCRTRRTRTWNGAI